MFRAVGRLIVGSFLLTLVVVAVVAVLFLNSLGHAQTTPAAPGAPAPGASSSTTAPTAPDYAPSTPYGSTVMSAARVTSIVSGIPLSTYLVAVGETSGRSVVPLDVPTTPVTIQVTAVPWGTFWATLTKAYALNWCELDGIIYVGSGDAIKRACGLKPVASKAYKVKLTLFTLDTDTSKSVGGDLGQLVGNVVSAVKSGSAVTLLTADWSRVFTALQTAGLGRRQDEVTLNTVDGQETAYRNGGSLSVNLVSDTQKIEKSVSYGFDTRITPFGLAGDDVDVHYTLDVASPVSVTNPALLQLASRTLSGVATLRAGRSVVLALNTSTRTDVSGRGLPGVAAAPGAGVLVGSSADADSRSTLLAVLGIE